MKKAIRVDRTGYTLTLHNKGQAVAKNISISASNNVNINEVFAPFPKQIYSCDYEKVEFTTYRDTPIPFYLTITWDDDFNKNNTYELTIN